MMMESEKPTGGTVGGNGQDSSFLSHSNQGAELCQGAVAAALRALGAFSYETRANKFELCHVLGLSSPRVLQQLINRERETAPICTSCAGGYWLGDPESEKGRTEINSTAATMERRAVETFATARAMRRWTKDPLGQIGMEDVHV